MTLGWFCNRPVVASWNLGDHYIFFCKFSFLTIWTAMYVIDLHHFSFFNDISFYLSLLILIYLPSCEREDLGNRRRNGQILLARKWCYRNYSFLFFFFFSSFFFGILISRKAAQVMKTLSLIYQDYKGITNKVTNGRPVVTGRITKPQVASVHEDL